MNPQQPTSPTRRATLGALSALALGAVAPAALAQPAAWPSRPLRLVVGFPAGGPADLFARTIAQKLTEIVGQQVVVDNRAGASGNIGVTAAIAGALDGTVSVALASNTNGVLGLTGVGLTAQSLAITGAAYDLASPVYAATQSLGNIRVGTTNTLAVTNALAVNGAREVIV